MSVFRKRTIDYAPQGPASASTGVTLWRGGEERREDFRLDMGLGGREIVDEDFLEATSGQPDAAIVPDNSAVAPPRPLSPSPSEDAVLPGPVLQTPSRPGSIRLACGDLLARIPNDLKLVKCILKYALAAIALVTVLYCFAFGIWPPIPPALAQYFGNRQSPAPTASATPE